MKALRALLRFYTHFGAGFVVGGLFVGVVAVLLIAAPATAQAFMHAIGALHGH